MSDVDELVAWLRAQLDDDEQTAREAAEAAAMTRELPPPPTRKWAHIARHDPARVLAEVAATRRIVEEYREAVELSLRDRNEASWSASADAFERVVTLLTLPYADWPGFRDEWRVE